MANAYLVQMQPSPNGKEASFALAREMVLKSAPEKGGLILFPEMFATGFLTHPDYSLAETLDAKSSPTVRFLQSLSDETGCFVLGGGIERCTGKDFFFQNWTGFFAPKASAPKAVYRKRHPFADEAELFRPGSDARFLDWEGFCVSPAICFDLRFPEDFREARRAGASLFTVQAEWPKARAMHFETLLRARAIENQCFVLAVSRAGERFANSCAFGPNGEELLTGSPEIKVFSVTLDVKSVQASRQSFPLPLR